MRLRKRARIHGVGNPIFIRLVESLLRDMSSLQVLYQQLKLFHWIIKGNNYIATHRFLDEVADYVLKSVDLIAERLVFLNSTPIADLAEIAHYTYVGFKEIKNDEFNFDEMIAVLDQDLNLITANLRSGSELANDLGDFGTEQLIQELIYNLEVFQHHIESFERNA